MTPTMSRRVTAPPEAAAVALTAAEAAAWAARALSSVNMMGGLFHR
jgi:hypothetical protein